MRRRRFVLGLAGTMAFVPFLLLAQQKPIAGCNAALNCRDGPFGYSALKGSGGSLLFGAGIRFGPGFQFFLVTPSLAPSPTSAVEGPMFHLRASLLPPPPTPTPVPEPSAKPPASGTPPKD
jgi:hypothetical protein